MKRLAIVLLLASTAAASPGHTVPEETSLFVHWTPDGPAMHPSLPEASSLPAAWIGEPCATHTWTVPFTQRDPDQGLQDVPELARTVSLAAAPARVAWYLEQVTPDGDPLDAPWPALHVRAQLLSPSGPVAAGAVTTTPTAVTTDRNVALITMDLSWSVEELPTDGLSLQIVATLDNGCTLPSIRAYGDGALASQVRFGVYEPIRIDRIEPIIADDVQFVVHASSPWGREDIVGLEPTVRSPDGNVATQLLNAVDEAGLVQTFGIDVTRNGTYRIDVIATSTSGSNDERGVVFQVGDDRPTPLPTTDERPAEATPMPVAWAIMGLVLAARRRFA